MDRKTGQKVAIKMIRGVLNDELHAKYVCRELKIMRHLSQIDDSIYTAKLIDVIIPKSKYDKHNTSMGSTSESECDSPDHIFLVQEYYGWDLDTFISKTMDVTLSEQHIKVIAYNMLCAAKYMHSGSIVHRDLKPGNVLINKDCNIKFCDMGLARTINAPETGSVS